MTGIPRCLIGLVVLLACTAACGGGAPGGSASPVRRLSIATGGTGGVFYPYGGGLAQILTTHLRGVEATAEATGASVDNLKFLQQGTSDLGFSMADAAQDALSGTDVFASSGQVPVRALAVVFPNYMHLVTREGSGIRRASDLRGRVVSLGAPGGGGSVQAERMLRAVGLDPMRDVRAQYLGVAQAADALKDGKLDAFFWSGGLPTASVLDLAHTPGLTLALLPLDDLVAPLQQRHGTAVYYPTVIPKETYGTMADVPVVAVANMLVTTAAFDEALAYDITRTLFEQQPALAAIHPQARTLALDRALTGATVPFHPGAIRYYREKGIWRD